jgi:transposase
MVRRYGLRDDQWEKIQDLLPGREGTVGVTAKENRLFVDAVIYHYRAGIPWRDLPERFGAWHNIACRHRRWSTTGVWPRVFAHLTHNRAKRVVAYAQAHALRQQGWTMKAIATHMGRPHRTVRKYLEASTFPERPPRRRPPSMLEPYKTSLLERWQAGCRSALELYREMQAQGCAGTYSIVAAYVSRFRPPHGRITRRRRSGSPATIVEVANR